MNYKENTIMLWDGQKVSDHARSALDVTFDILERRRRMANGTLRKFVIARKMKISCSWEMLPSRGVGETGPVDGGLTGEQMLEFYRDKREFTLTLRDGAGNIEQRKVMLEEFRWSVAKRGTATDFWNIDMTLEEV